MWGDRRAGHGHVRRTFANFLGEESGDIKHNQRTCLPDGLCGGKAPQRGFLLTLCPGQKLAEKAAGTGTTGVCLSNWIVQTQQMAPGPAP